MFSAVGLGRAVETKNLHDTKPSVRGTLCEFLNLLN